jgi:hypothetical protein
MATNFTQRDFEPAAGEMVAYEAAVTLIRGVAARFARLYLTDRRVVFCIPTFWQLFAGGGGMGVAGAVAATAASQHWKHKRIAEEAPLSAITALEAGKFGLSKTVVISRGADKAIKFALAPNLKPETLIAAIEGQRQAH